MQVTIFTPTYNRAKLIDRVFDSLRAIKGVQFEWLIIDDGSIDNTREVVHGFMARSDFPIRYYFQENAGKVASINRGLDLANGDFFLVFDSDDWCTPDALSVFLDAYNALTVRQQQECGAVSCLKAYRDGTVVGERYDCLSRGTFDYVDRFNMRVKGDKWEFIKTDVHRLAKYDLAPGERYMAPEYSWIKIALAGYKTVFIDKVLSIVEYQDDGISKNNIKHRVSSPVSAVKFYNLGFSVSTGNRNKLRAASNLVRFNLHTKRPPSGDSFIVEKSLIGFIACVVGYVMYLRDLRALRH